MKRLGFAAAAVAIALALALLTPSCGSAIDESRPGNGRSVTITQGDWDTGHFQAAVYVELLERLGYEVTDPADNQAPSSEMFDKVASGDADFSANGWFPTDQLDRELADGTTIGDALVVVGQQMPSGGLEGLLIDRQSAIEYNIKTLGDVADDPALVERFDADGNGLIDIYGCPESWGCHTVIDKIIADVGPDSFEQLSADDYGTGFVDFKRRVSSGRSAIAYTWSPNHTVAVLRPGREVTWLSVGPDIGGAVLPSGLPCTATPCHVGWNVSDIRVFANRSFIEREPAAHALFEAVKIAPADVYAQNLEMDRGADSPEELADAVDRWIQDNRALVVDWLDYARSRA